MEVTGYQTLENRNNKEVVESEGPFECTRSNAWLGNGYYFWDTEIDWAHDWGKKGYKGSYFIGECQLSLSKCFDLVGNMAHLKDFREVYDVVLNSHLGKDPKNLIVPNIIALLKKKTNFSYTSIRAEDVPKGTNSAYYRQNRDELMYLNKRSQICVIDKNQVLLSPFKVVHP